MALTNLSDITESQKQDLVASLAAIVVGKAADECTAEGITAVVEASGNSIDASTASLFASVVKMAGGIKKFCAAPGAGGGGGGGAAAASGGAAAAEEPQEEEEEEAEIGGGVDMFGSGGGGGDY
jgi:large subunit ribosomal protein LP1